MQTVYFSDGTTADVENVRGGDPKTFTIPSSSYGAFANAFTKNATLRFGPHEPVYLLSRMQGQDGVAQLQVSRR